MKKKRNNDQDLLTWQARSTLKGAIRSFFHTKNYLEIDTPIAVPCPGTEVHLDYFKTHWNDFLGKSHPLWLRSSPELHMKQALSQGLDKIFQIATCFRNNGELTEWHHPEFSMLEWYELGITFDGFIQQTENLLRYTWNTFREKNLGNPKIKFPDTFEKISVAESFLEFAGLRLIDNDPDLASKAKEMGINSIHKDDDFETAFFKVILEKVEPALQRLEGVVLFDYPPSQAALSKVENGFAKRFEYYISGVELCNGFNELLDAKENISRIKEANAQRKILGKEVCLEDQNFYAALESGINSCCGNALGFDRWLAFCLGHANLDDIIPFREQNPYLQKRYPGKI